MAPRRKALITILKLTDLAVVTAALVTAVAFATDGARILDWQAILEMRLSLGNVLVFAMYIVAWHFILKVRGLYKSYRLSPASRELRDIGIAVLIGAAPVALAVLLGSLSERFLVALALCIFVGLAVSKSLPLPVARYDALLTYGLIATIPLVATVISGGGATGRDTSSGSRNLHAALGLTSFGLYSISAYYAIAAPRIAGTKTSGNTKWHKALAWVHGAGMILTPALGAMAYDQKRKGEEVHGIAKAHGGVAVATVVAYAVAMATEILK